MREFRERREGLLDYPHEGVRGYVIVSETLSVLLRAGNRCWFYRSALLLTEYEGEQELKFGRGERLTARWEKITRSG